MSTCSPLFCRSLKRYVCAAASGPHPWRLSLITDKAWTTPLGSVKLGQGLVALKDESCPSRTLGRWCHHAQKETRKKLGSVPILRMSVLCRQNLSPATYLKSHMDRYTIVGPGLVCDRRQHGARGVLKGCCNGPKIEQRWKHFLHAAMAVVIVQFLAPLLVPRALPKVMPPQN